MDWLICGLACGLLLVMELRIQLMQKRLIEQERKLAELQPSDQANPDILPFRSYE